MPNRRTQSQVYRDLLERYGRSVADAFFAALADLRSRVEFQRVVAALQQGNVQAAIEALHLDATAYNRMLEALRQAHMESGEATAGFLPKRTPDGIALAIRFDGRNLAAERILAEQSARLVTRLAQDDISVVRTALTSGLEAGRNPTQTAVDVVGRINRVTGKRDGGVLGLSVPQEQYVRTARDQLSSGDPAAMREYLTREARDERFDRSVAKAIREGKPVDPAITDNAIRSYTNRLIKVRGNAIGRTETLRALNQAQYEALRQAVADGKIPAISVRRVWSSSRDFMVRDSHAVMHGESVGLDEAFISPRGARLLFPGDTSQGAPGSETIQCRCQVTTRIDWLSNLR